MNSFYSFLFHTALFCTIAPSCLAISQYNFIEAIHVWKEETLFQLRSLEQNTKTNNTLPIEFIKRDLDSLIQKSQHSFVKHIYQCIYNVTSQEAASPFTVKTITEKWSAEIQRLGQAYGTKERIVPTKELRQFRLNIHIVYAINHSKAIESQLVRILEKYTGAQHFTKKEEEVIYFCYWFQRHISQNIETYHRLKEGKGDLPSKTISLDLLEDYKKRILADSQIEAIDRLLQVIETNAQNSPTVKSLAEKIVVCLETMRTDSKYIRAVYWSRKNEKYTADPFLGIYQWVIASVKQ